MPWRTRQYTRLVSLETWINETLRREDSAAVDALRRELVNAAAHAEDMHAVLATYDDMVEAWTHSPHDEDPRAALDRTRRDLGSILSEQPHLAVAVGVYARAKVQACWEQSWPTRGLIACLSIVHQTLGGLTEGQPVRELSLTLSLLDLTRQELECEATSTSGTIEEWGCAAATIADTAERSARQTCSGVVASALCDTIADLSKYYSAVAAAVQWCADTVNSTGAVREDPFAQIEEAMTAVDPIKASQLQAVGSSVRALQRGLDQEWLIVDRGALTVLFPFGLRDCTPDEALAATARDGASWAFRVGGQEVLAPMPRNDIWDGRDSLGRSYDGVAIAFEDLEVANGPAGFRTWNCVLRLTTLGNHHIALSTGLADVGPQLIYEMSKLASPEAALTYFAGPQLRFAGGAKVRSLPDAVNLILSDLANFLRLSYPKTKVVQPEGNVRAITLIAGASALDRPSGRRRRVWDSAEVSTLFGFGVLANPIDAGVYAPAQWATWGAGAPTVERLAVSRGIDVRSTVSTTSVTTIGLPMWWADILIDLVLFVDSLEGLFAAWQDELSSFHAKSLDFIRSVDHLVRGEGVDAVRSARELRSELQQRQIEIRAFLAWCQGTLLFIRSRSIVLSPAIDEILRELLDHSNFESSVEAHRTASSEFIDAQLSEAVHELEGRIERATEQQQEREARHRRRLLDAAMIGVSVTGVSGLAQIMQSGYSIIGGGAVALIGGIVAFALAGVWMSWRSSREGRP